MIFVLSTRDTLVARAGGEMLLYLGITGTESGEEPPGITSLHEAKLLSVYSVSGSALLSDETLLAVLGEGTINVTACKPGH